MKVALTWKYFVAYFISMIKFAHMTFMIAMHFTFAQGMISAKVGPHSGRPTLFINEENEPDMSEAMRTMPSNSTWIIDDTTGEVLFR